jgi:pyridoxine 4-dehydrogenase
LSWCSYRLALSLSTACTLREFSSMVNAGGCQMEGDVQGEDQAFGGSLVLGGELVVRRLGFGAMRLTGRGIWGEPADPAKARDVLRRAVALGVTFIDTADSYGPEVSERLIAEALHPYPPNLVIATKGGLTRPGPDRWERDGRPQHLRAACEASLKRLRLERIDLYQLHSPDPRVPLEESLAALQRLQAEGKIRHIGVSNVSVAQLRQARQQVAVVSVQNRYNLFDRGSEDVLEECERESLAFIPWYPLAAGKGPTADDGRSALSRLARRLGATPMQVALAALLARSRVMLPIPGTASLAHLEENVAAASLKLSQADLRALG